MKNILFSVIIPVYNVEKYVGDCIESVIKQTIDSSNIEIILVNDGSSDSSGEVCNSYASRYEFINVIHQENQGVSAARNNAIMRAKGKYLFYLDSDDTILPETLESVAKVFEAHYDEIDIMTYPEIHKNEDGSIMPEHFRYDYLKCDGVYDLTEPQNVYISLTNMNICVKNQFEKNVLFSTQMKYGHEDQKYCLDILRSKMKVGYSEKGGYVYLQRSSSAIHSFFYSYYIFEDTMKFWEDAFASFRDSVPGYLQALYINDIAWKTSSDLLMPYHYSKDKFKEAEDRITALLKKVDDEVIINHPKINTYLAQYFIKQKLDSELYTIKGVQDLAVADKNGKIICDIKAVEIFFTRVKLIKGILHLEGSLRSPIFDYINFKPDLYISVNGDQYCREKLELFESSWGYYLSKVKVATAWGFRFSAPIKDIKTISLSVDVCGKTLRNYFRFSRFTPFKPAYRRTFIYAGEYKIKLDANACSFTVLPAEDKKQYLKENRVLYSFYLAHSLRVLYYRLKAYKWKSSDERIWLYYDCANVKKDNGYYQFVHDFDKDDGVKRYYVINDDLDRSDMFTSKMKNSLIRFGSKEHKKLFLSCEKIITAFIEENNYIPFKETYTPHLTDLMTFELIYLQHGVLHAHLPWKYSFERMPVDREVISTTFEYESLTNNYNFAPENLIKCGMPRYNHIDAAATPVNRILYAPTWRKYLISMDEDRNWVPERNRFLDSEYFKKTNAFLNDERLIRLLEENDLYLDFKLHPIFSIYSDCYNIKSKRVSMAGANVSECSYKVFITDFSSFVFDFAYLKRPIIYFVPDYDLFKSGSGDYRELDMPLENGLGEFSTDADGAVASLTGIIERGFKSLPEFSKKMDGLFYDVDDHEEALYQELIK